MSDIAELISDMVRQGIDPDLIGRTAAAFAERNAKPIDEQAERRRANDRERKRLRNSAESAEIDVTPSPFPSPLSSPPTPPPIIPQTHTPTPNHTSGAKKVGSRISDEWHVGEIEFSEALKIGLTRDQIQFEGERFRDFWTSKSGKDATKLDWLATWRNWCRSAFERSKPRLRSQAPPKPKSEHVLRHEAFQREFDKVINGASNEPDSNIIDLAARDFRSYGAA